MRAESLLRIAATTIVTISLSSLQGIAQDRVDDELDPIRRVLQALFPDLNDTAHVNVWFDVPFRSLDWATPNQRSVSIRVQRSGSEKPIAKTTEPRDNNEYLAGAFTLGDDFIKQADLFGRRVRSGEMMELLASLRENPTSTAVDLDRSIAAKGGKFPSSDNDRFMSTLSLTSLADALGIIRNKELQFVWRQGNPDLGADDIMMPNWVLKLRTDDARGRIMCYALFFEPLDGNLTGMVGSKCD